jgi:hypothetical protein
LVGIPDLLQKEVGGYVPGDIKSGAGQEGGDEDGDGKPKLHYAVQLTLYVDILERLGLSAGRRGFRKLCATRLYGSTLLAVADVASTEEFFGAGRVGPAEMPSSFGAASFAGSVILHGLVLVPFFVAGRHGFQALRGGAEFIPVEVVERGNGAPATAPKGASAKPRQQASEQSPAGAAQNADESSVSQGRTGGGEADALTAKLEPPGGQGSPRAQTDNDR